jgi:opacity protein-like surface antigen
MRLTLFALTAAILVACGPAAAKNPARGWFLGLDAGTSQLDGEVEYAGIDTLDFDDNATNVTVHAGYRFSRFLSLGVSYTDFGDFSVSEPGLRLDASVRGVAMNFVARIPLGERIGLQATVSALGRDLDISARAPGEAPFAQGTRGLVTRLGLGLGYKVSDHVDVSVDFATTRDVGHVFMGMGVPVLHFNGNLHSLTAGLRYKF